MQDDQTDSATVADNTAKTVAGNTATSSTFLQIDNY